MKVQFVPDGLRIRVTRDEFARLRKGQPLELDVAGHWRIGVRAAAGPALELAPGRLDLGLPAADLDDLASRLPAREGVEATVEAGGRTLRLAFEVDLLDGRPRRPR